MRVVNLQKLAELQHNPRNIRNICIMAHVDHGKTTLADSLVASNGIISKRMVGKLRYMDSRKDEQERGITMKSSSISLHYARGNDEFLVNLIDSPGHVDFSSEVSTAVRLCDGAIILVDVVEGVCAQTKVVLRQAWLESIRPVLVLNKIDRLIVEMKFQPLDAYIHLSQVLEQINAYVGELFAAEVLSKASSKADWNIDDEDDSHIYFSPTQGNVVFASASDGWGFTIQQFAKLFATKLGVSEADLSHSLWGDFYYSPKTKTILEGAQMKAKKPLFVQLALENLWSVYESIVVRKDKAAIEKIVKSLNLQIPPRELSHNDVKIQLQAVISQWLPLSNSILSMVCDKLPSPVDMSEIRAENLISSQSSSFKQLPENIQSLKKSFIACSASEDEPVVVFISKMVPVERHALPQNKPRPLTAEDIARRREMIRQKLAQQQLQDTTGENKTESSVREHVEELQQADKKEIENEEVFVAFARVYSGTLRKGQQLYVLGPKYDPSTMADTTVDPELTLKDLKAGQHVTKATISDLYLLMGRELELLEEVPAGNVVGIGGLDEHVLKSATLSSTLHCPAFTEVTLMAVPIVRVAVEPIRAADMAALIRGLKLLNQADPCVQVLLQETGEHVLVTAGEVHLQRCLQDLRERYAKIEINSSQPIVPFRETVVAKTAAAEGEFATKKSDDEAVVEMQTPNKRCTIRLRAVPLPAEVTEFLERNASSLKAMAHEDSSDLALVVSSLVAKTTSQADAAALKEELAGILDKCGPLWKGAIDSIWSFGPRRCGPNILLNRSGVSAASVWQSRSEVDSSLLEIHNSVVNGFQLATLSGPLCEEPLMGVAFIVEHWSIISSESDVASQPYGPFTGQIMSMVKEGCRRAFQAQPQRIMAAMYTCSIQVSAEVLGKMYGVISRRHGRVLAGDLDEGTATFSVTAVLPVIESFDLANEIRKQTSGQASPQLVFTHWEVIDTDPFWVPTTEEELELYGDKGDSINRAQVYMNSVRRRKGLPVLEKVVEFAEKQRTLSRKV